MDDDSPLASEIAPVSVGRVRFRAVTEERPAMSAHRPGRAAERVRRRPGTVGSDPQAGEAGSELARVHRLGVPGRYRGAAGIVARPVDGLGVDTPRPAGLASAYRGRMPSAATVV